MLVMRHLLYVLCVVAGGLPHEARCRTCTVAYGAYCLHKDQKKLDQRAFMYALRVLIG